MASRAVFVAGCIAAVLIAAATMFAQPNQRALFVSVLDQAGAPVPDLGPSDFLVREDNAAREVLHVEPATDPMQVALLIDNSQASRDAIADLRKSLHEFVAAITAPAGSRGRNEVALITLADRPTIVADSTFDAALLDKAVDRVFAQTQAGTLLLEGLIETCKGFKKREALRPVIVAVVTIGPELSDRYHDLVLGPLKDSGAAFHAIVIGPGDGPGGLNTLERGIVLDQGTRDSGGRRDNVLSSMALPAKLTQVAAELTHQYRVTYARPQSLIPPERVTVSATRPGLTARGTPVRELRQGSRQ